MQVLTPANHITSTTHVTSEPYITSTNVELANSMDFYIHHLTGPKMTDLEHVESLMPETEFKRVNFLVSYRFQERSTKHQLDGYKFNITTLDKLFGRVKTIRSRLEQKLETAIDDDHSMYVEYTNKYIEKCRTYFAYVEDNDFPQLKYSEHLMAFKMKLYELGQLSYTAPDIFIRKHIIIIVTEFYDKYHDLLDSNIPTDDQIEILLQWIDTLNKLPTTPGVLDEKQKLLDMTNIDMSVVIINEY